MPNLEACKQPIFKGKPVELIGLLGRDVMRYCRINYDGIEGRLDFYFDIRALQAVPSR